MDPIQLSICVGISVLVISVIIMYIWNPDFVVRKDSKNKKQIYWEKLISIGIVMGSVGSIIIAIGTIGSTEVEIPEDEVKNIYNSF
jgi:hypothetical protein